MKLYHIFLSLCKHSLVSKHLGALIDKRQRQLTVGRQRLFFIFITHPPHIHKQQCCSLWWNVKTVFNCFSEISPAQNNLTWGRCVVERTCCYRCLRIWNKYINLIKRYWLVPLEIIRFPIYVLNGFHPVSTFLMRHSEWVWFTWVTH